MIKKESKKKIDEYTEKFNQQKFLEDKQEDLDQDDDLPELEEISDKEDQEVSIISYIDNSIKMYI